MLYVISDPHYDEYQIIDAFYSYDFFMSAEAYMSYTTRRWNDKIKDDDTVIIVGDAGDPTRYKQLRGHKILVRGNHDDYEEHKYKCFDKVTDHIYLVESGVRILFEHIRGSTDKPADIIICGHSHNVECYRYHEPDKTIIYAITNLLGYEPRTLSELFDSEYHNWPYELFRIRELVSTGGDYAN